MQPVTQNLGRIPESDVRAIAIYIATLAGRHDETDRQKQTQAALAFAQQRAATVTVLARTTTGAAATTDTSAGAALFAGTCATCHHSGGGLPLTRPIPLALSTPVNETDPTNLLRIVLDGIHPRAGARGPTMPGFSGALTDPQIVALVTYVRTHYSRRPPWPNVAGALAAARQRQTPTTEAP
jgi:mono/diheme cytochrome c family protein